jgi:methionine-rich copper-binding protein CopC
VFLSYPHWLMTTKIEGQVVTNSSTASCQIRMSVLMMKDFTAEASTTLTIALNATIITARMIVRNSAVIIKSLATGRITVLIGIDNQFGAWASQLRRPFFSKIIGLFAMLGMLTGASAAIAHPKLESSDPAPDSTLSSAPKEIRLNLSEGVLAKFSGIELKDEAGKPIATGEPATDPKDKKQLIVPVTATLIPSRYTVTWHAVSDDTHRVEGKFSFKLAQGSAAGASTEKPSGTETRRDSELQSANRDDRGDGMCKCPSSEDRNVSRESDRDDRTDRSRMQRNDRDSDGAYGYRGRDRDLQYRDGPRSRPECVIDNEGTKYCRTR